MTKGIHRSSPVIITNTTCRVNDGKQFTCHHHSIATQTAEQMTEEIHKQFLPVIITRDVPSGERGTAEMQTPTN
jgi:hypothetical protein